MAKMYDSGKTLGRHWNLFRKACALRKQGFFYFIFDKIYYNSNSNVTSIKLPI